MPTFNAPLPPTRSTGDAPPEGPAGDVNMLTVAVTEVRGEVPDPPDLSGYVTTVDAGATYVVVVEAGTDLSIARPAGAGTVLFKFSAGVDVGVEGANVVNAEPGDLFVVRTAP